MSDRKIGYIGLGNMGGGMASHLVASGYDVTVFDLRAEAVHALVDKGATAASSPKEVAETCDVIISSLPTPQSVENAATGENGLVHGLSAGKVYIDMSTIDPDTTRRVGAAVRATGAEMLDVPVGMGPPHAARGELTLMIGGNASVVEDCKDVLDTLGGEQFYCGELGSGATTKIVNNLVSCSVATLLGEAVTLGVAAGLDPERLRNVMNNTAASTLHGRNGLKAKVLSATSSLALSSCCRIRIWDLPRSSRHRWARRIWWGLPHTRCRRLPWARGWATKTSMLRLRWRRRRRVLRSGATTRHRQLRERMRHVRTRGQ